MMQRLNQADPLPSWRSGQLKTRILTFVDAVCDPTSSHYVDVEDRIATFDNDGTLWVEKPLMTQLVFIKEHLIHQGDASAADKSSFLDGVKHGFENILHSAEDDIKELAKDVFDGLTTQEYRQQVSDWISTAIHPRFDTLYTDLVYQPMLELLALLMKHDFSCFIVSGGSADFIRPWCNKSYGIPLERVIGSSMRTDLVAHQHKLRVELEPLPFFFDNGKGKVLSIDRQIAKVPIVAVGNSSGDAEMLTWSQQDQLGLSLLVHHTDAEREYSYSPDEPWHLGTPTLTLAKQQDWGVIDMKTDWLQIFRTF